MSTAFDRLTRDIAALASGIGARDRAHPDGLARAAAHVHAAFAAAGGTAFRQAFSVAGATYENVIARFGPERGPLVVAGAHYDAVEGSPGADDNASGVAGLIELSRRFGAAPPPVPVELAAYTLEESAFATDQMGSARHAQGLRAAGADVRLMVSLEMLGYYADAPGTQQAPDPRLLDVYGTAGNFVMVVGRPEDAAWTSRIESEMRRHGGIPVHAINAPREVPGIDLSDHRNFWDAGFPAVMITDTAFYRNPNYHTPDDTPGTLDVRRMAGAVDAIEAALRAVMADLAGQRGAPSLR